MDKGLETNKDQFSLIFVSKTNFEYKKIEL